ncbi:MAG: hypothetical protein ACK55I_39830, partial [bacterium]
MRGGVAIPDLVDERRAAGRHRARHGDARVANRGEQRAARDAGRAHREARGGGAHAAHPVARDRAERSVHRRALEEERRRAARQARDEQLQGVLCRGRLAAPRESRARGGDGVWAATGGRGAVATRAGHGRTVAVARDEPTA